MTRRPERRAAGEPRPVRGAATSRGAAVGRGVKRIGLYPGTFDPITNGHLDIIGRAVKLVDKLIIGVAINEGKGPLFSLEERTEMVLVEARKLARGIEIEARPFDTLLMHFAEECGAQMIIRGLRAVSDFEYEFQMASMNRHLIPEVETLFLTPAEQYGFISSSLVREISRLGGDVSGFVPAAVADALQAEWQRDAG